MVDREGAHSLQFFMSYTAADLAWAEWIAWQLEAAGHRVILQAWDFRPGENFIVNMRRALDSSDRTLAVVSAAYLKSVYGSDEWTAAFIHDRPGETNVLAVRIEEVPLPRLLRPWIYIDLVGMDAEAAAATLLAGLEQGRRKPVQPPAFPMAAQPTGPPSFPGQGPAVSNLPSRNRTFTGRTGLLTRLHQQLTTGDVGSGGPVAMVAGALYGLGGVGKTQLALEYAHRYGADYDVVWWIPSENALTIPAMLARLARRLGLAIQGDQEELAELLLDALRARDRWLLVFDNAEQPEELARWLPGGGGGHVLVTSRHPAWGALAQPIQVDVFDRIEAVTLLLRRTPDQDQASAAQLAEQLGDLPLALEQAAAYLERTGMPLAAYLAAYQRRRQQLLAKGHPVAYQGQVETTWQLSIDRLDPAGVELLQLCAFLAPEAIPLDLFAAPDRLPAALAAAVAEEGELAVQEAAGACYRYSLVARDQPGIRVHRLLQQVVRAQLAEHDRRARITTVAELLAAAFPPARQLRDPASWPRAAQLLPHMLTATDHARAAGLATATTASLLGRAGTYLHLRRRAEHAVARGLLERALSIYEAAGVDPAEVGGILNSLGLVLRDQADLTAARAHLERALAIQEAALGPDHVDVGITLERLGRVLRDQRDLAAAQAHLERAQTILQAALGPQHPWVARDLDYLGLVLAAQGDLAGARAHLERAYTMQQAALGPEHPWVARTMDSLGRVLYDQGDLDGARRHLERALAIDEATIGADHPQVSGILDRLGRVLHQQGDLAGARAQLERALAIAEATVGPEHHWVGGTLDILGQVLHDQGDLAAARGCLQRAHTILLTELGPEHHDTQAVARRLERL
jgi:tetratricopeptide (TPR) repeat protein